MKPIYISFILLILITQTITSQTINYITRNTSYTPPTESAILQLDAGPVNGTYFPMKIPVNNNPDTNIGTVGTPAGLMVYNNGSVQSVQYFKSSASSFFLTANGGYDEAINTGRSGKKLYVSPISASGDQPIAFVSTTSGAVVNIANSNLSDANGNNTFTITKRSFVEIYCSVSGMNGALLPSVVSNGELAQSIVRERFYLKNNTTNATIETLNIARNYNAAFAGGGNINVGEHIDGGYIRAILDPGTYRIDIDYTGFFSFTPGNIFVAGGPTSYPTGSASFYWKSAKNDSNNNTVNQTGKISVYIY